MRRGSIWLLVAMAALAAHFALVLALMRGLVLDVGRLVLPTAGFMVLVGSWANFGTAAAAALAAATTIWLAARGRGDRWATRWRAIPDRTVAIALTIFAVAMASAVRLLLLRGVALTDDEASYRFAAELIASGRLWVPSHPLKLHFDHPFFINDGRFQSAYFLGWPALAAPGVWLGMVGYMNALYFGASVPAVFLVSRRLFGSTWARIAAALFVTSPFMIVLSATELAHTSCLAALAWALWALLRTRDPESRPRHHAFLAIAFSVAFFVRPISGLGVGGPLLMVWAIDRWRSRGGRRAAISAFAAPALVFAFLFLGLQDVLHGSPWTTSYAHVRSYRLANDLRFTTWKRSDMIGTPGLDFHSPARDFAITSGGLVRLGTDLFGWPIGLLALGLAAGARRSGLAWAMAAGGLVEIFFQKDPGVDSFGPVHYAELVLPVVLLTVAAGIQVSSWLERGSGPGAATGPRRWIVPSSLFALVLSAWLGFVPFRWATLAAISGNIDAPIVEAERDAQRPAVIFASYRFVACPPMPAQHFRFMRPVNDPDLQNPILWVNHVTLESDRRLMTYFPNRHGYAQVWTPDCQPHLLPLELATDGNLPPANMHPAN